MTIGCRRARSFVRMETPGDRQRDSHSHRPSRGKIERFPHGELTEAIIGGMFTVYREFGAGFLESVYANALAVEVRARGLRVDRNVAYEIYYQGVLVGRYVADLVVESKVIVETKAARSIDTSHRAQTLNYLHASKLEVGIVLNFGTTPQFKRVVRSHSG
jgi:GxxExxY protein